MSLYDDPVATARYERGVVAHRRGDLATARACFAAAVAANPAHVSAAARLAEVERDGRLRRWPLGRRR